MTLRDRIRRWWSPAQWEDDHPAQRGQHEKPSAYPGAGTLGVTYPRESTLGVTGEGGVDSERDLKKPR